MKLPNYSYISIINLDRLNFPLNFQSTPRHEMLPNFETTSPTIVSQNKRRTLYYYMLKL